MTDLYTDAGRSILRELFEFYCDRELDDAEYIPVVKTIVRGIEKSMSEQSGRISRFLQVGIRAR